MKIAVSACLLGQNCKYNGGNNRHEWVLRLVEGHEVLPICPEAAGGLPCPRPPAEIVGERVLNNRGEDVTAAFHLGAATTLQAVRDFGAELVILKSRSPSCGTRTVYDGTFSGALVPGQGVAAAMLTAAGFRVINEDEIDTCNL